MTDLFVYTPPNEPLQILYSDKDIVLVNKPSGLLSVPGKGADKKDSMLTRLQGKYPLVYAVHRLDMDTSGIMVFALRRKAERNLKLQFQRREVHKEYRAVVQGFLSTKEDLIDAPLGLDPVRKLRHCIREDGRSAQTHYRVLSEGLDCSLLQLKPITGRSHQLRVHLNSIGHPILGDRFYAPEEIQSRSPRLLLHAQELCFSHPYSKEKMRHSIDANFRRESRFFP